MSNDPPFSISATASSGLPITYTIVSGPATINGTTMTLTGAGDVTVKAVQAGNDSFNSASAQQTFNVELFVGLEDVIENLTIGPNPATSTILVQLPSTYAFKALALKDMLGREVLNMDLTQQEIALDVEKFPRGIYIVRLFGDENIVYSKRVILK